MSVFIDMHLHLHHLIPYPFRAIVNFSQRKTKPETFYLKNMQNAKINLVVANAVGDKIVTSLYGFNSFKSVKKQLIKIKKSINDAGLLLFDNWSSLKEGLDENKGVVMLGVEGADFVNGRIDRLKEIYDLGVRALTLVHFSNNCFGHIGLKVSDLAKSTNGTTAILNNENNKGITSFGRKAIEDLNSLPILIDVAHANTKTANEVINQSAEPVIASHSGALSIQPSFLRYASDDVIINLAKSKGMIGLWPYFFKNKGMENVAAFIEHAKYISKLVGPRYIGIGSDINALPGIMSNFEYERDFCSLVEILQSNGFNKLDAEGIMGQNFLNILKKVFK